MSDYETHIKYKNRVTQNNSLDFVNPAANGENFAQPKKMKQKSGNLEK